MKAADIPDRKIYEIIQLFNRPANCQDIQHALPDFLPKVVMAKLRQMINKGRLNGCACGCRGDFSVPEKYT